MSWNSFIVLFGDNQVNLYFKLIRPKKEIDHDSLQTLGNQELKPFLDKHAKSPVDDKYKSYWFISLELLNQATLLWLKNVSGRSFDHFSNQQTMQLRNKDASGIWKPDWLGGIFGAVINWAVNYHEIQYRPKAIELAEKYIKGDKVYFRENLGYGEISSSVLSYLFDELEAKGYLNRFLEDFIPIRYKSGHLNEQRTIFFLNKIVSTKDYD